MKRKTLLAVTAFSLFCLSGQVLTVQAAPVTRKQMQLNGNRVIVSYNACNTQSLAELLKDCFPTLCLPEINFPGTVLPDCNVPETDLPEVEMPDSETPDEETPDFDKPNIETPETEAPDFDRPDIDVPDTNIPDFDMPDTILPDIDIPDNNTPETNLPENTPDNNHPGVNTPDTNTPGNDTSIENSTLSQYITEIVSLVNAERAKEGLSPLTINVQVQAAAQVRAKECEQSFSHTRPNGTSFTTALKEQNVSYRSAGENIAWGQRSPEAVMKAWMNSSGHRANIMNPNFTTIGVGYYQNVNGTNYWCQLFTR